LMNTFYLLYYPFFLGYLSVLYKSNIVH